MEIAAWALVLAVVGGLAALSTRYARGVTASSALGEVRDDRYHRGLWRLEAARLIVRQRKDGGEVRLLYRTPSTTMRFSCPPAEARRIAHALREAARAPLPGRRP